MATTSHIERIIVSGDRVSVPLLVWRRFHRAMPGLVEATLASNPGLADLGPFLPVGTAVDMPIPVDEAATAKPAISLW